jgi:multiple sugar transport system permease protein
MTAILEEHRGTDPSVLRPPARRRRNRGRQLTILAFMAPWLIGLTLFFIYPALATLAYSFTNFDLIDNPTFAGLRNYQFLFSSDPLLVKSIGNTAWLTLAITVGRVAFGLLAAVILVRIKRGAGVFRTLFYLPALAPPVAASLAFVFLLNPATGPVNQFLHLLGIQGPLWFNDPDWAKPSLAVLGLWTSGTIIVIFLAALLDVPGELYEAASLDGANAWQQFRSITVPAISPVITFAVVNSIIVGLQYFTEAVVAGAVASGSTYTAGSSNNLGYPDNATLTFPMWLYEQAFHQFHMGYASAMAIVLFLVSGVFTVVLVNRMRSAGIGEEEE